MICMFKEMNTYTFGKIKKNVRKIDIKLATAKNTINYWCQNQIIVQQNSFPKLC